MTRQTVLVAEADPQTESLLDTVVEELCQTHTFIARDVQGAESILQEMRPSLIIVDDCPGSDPVSLMETIQGLPESLYISVVALVDDMDRGMVLVRHGADAFLTKPLDIESLRDLILSASVGLE